MACSDSDYEYLRKLVQAQSANVIDASRNVLFETRLAPLARVAGVTSLEDLVGKLRTDRPAHLQRAVAEAMTINETSFFRDVATFDALREEVIPKLMEQKRQERQLRIWSAASSTGQEAYSLAILLLEYFPELASWDVKIIGTDLSHEVIDYAKRGSYRRLEVNRGLRARLLTKYFKREGEEWKVSEQVRALCEFKVADLSTPPATLPLFDLTLLRNVLLYFAPQNRGRVYHEVYKRLRPRGYLILGNAEQAEDSTDLFQVEFTSACYFYRPAKKA